jgi:hypothetical protein
MRYGRPHVLVRWAGCDASGDTWEPLDTCSNREEAISAFSGPLRQVEPVLRQHRRAGLQLSLPHSRQSAQFAVDSEAAPPGDVGAALVGQTTRMLYSRPTDGGSATLSRRSRASVRGGAAAF